MASLPQREIMIYSLKNFEWEDLTYWRPGCGALFLKLAARSTLKETGRACCRVAPAPRVSQLPWHFSPVIFLLVHHISAPNTPRCLEWQSRFHSQGLSVHIATWDLQAASGVRFEVSLSENVSLVMFSEWGIHIFCLPVSSMEATVSS